MFFQFTFFKAQLLFRHSAKSFRHNIPLFKLKNPSFCRKLSLRRFIFCNSHLRKFPQGSAPHLQQRHPHKNSGTVLHKSTVDFPYERRNPDSHRANGFANMENYRHFLRFYHRCGKNFRRHPSGKKTFQPKGKFFRRQPAVFRKSPGKIFSPGQVLRVFHVLFKQTAAVERKFFA